MASKLNKSWHDTHVMPKNATSDQRIAWHLEHQANCGCRPVPVRIREKIEGGAKAGRKRSVSQRIGRH